jgi:hypothetical protein
VTAEASCLDCGAEIVDRDQVACPECGGPNRAIHAGDEGTGAETEVRVRGRHGAVGEVRPHRDLRVSVRWNHDRQQHEQRRMLIDYGNNRYEQTWSTLDTGEVTFHKEGCLDDPAVHGKSARSTTLRAVAEPG